MELFPSRPSLYHELHVLSVSEDYEPYEANKQHGCIFSSMVRLSPFSAFTELASYHSIAGPQFIVCPQSGIESSHDLFSLPVSGQQTQRPPLFRAGPAGNWGISAASFWIEMKSWQFQVESYVDAYALWRWLKSKCWWFSSCNPTSTLILVVKFPIFEWLKVKSNVRKVNPTVVTSSCCISCWWFEIV